MLGYLAVLAVALLASLPLLVVLRHAPPLTDDPISPKERSMNLFAQANANLNLTPTQRAVLQLIENLALAFFVSALPVLSSLLSTSGTIDWPSTLRIAGATGAMAVLAAAKKWAKAQGDSPLLTAAVGLLDAGSAHLATEFGLNESVTEPEPEPTPPTDTPAAASLDIAA